MSLHSMPNIPHYTPGPPTTENLEYADLAIIDLSKADHPEGRAELAIQARDAMREQGFFYVINHGYSQEKTNRIFDIANFTFDGVCDEQKKKYEGENVGTYEGYKPRKFWHINGGVKDEVEHYVANRNVHKREHPEALRPLLPEIEAFARHNHIKVAFTILRLLAIGLELPEDTFVREHEFTGPSETHVRFMKYYPRSVEEEAITNNVWLKGHTDFGTITLLWSQPIGGLQILSRDGKWRWIRHIDNALVINAGDAMEFMSGGYYKATIHRVIQPPQDQRNKPRVGVFYFVRTEDDLKLIPYGESPVLQRVGIKRRFADENAPTMRQWEQGRTSTYGKIQLKQGTEKGIEEEMVSGVLVKHYN